MNQQRSGTGQEEVVDQADGSYRKSEWERKHPVLGQVTEEGLAFGSGNYHAREPNISQSSDWFSIYADGVCRYRRTFR